jgi:hypothetical protein
MVKCRDRNYKIEVVLRQELRQYVAPQEGNVMRDARGSLRSGEAFMIHVDGDDLIAVASQFLSKRASPTPHIKRSSTV